MYRSLQQGKCLALSMIQNNAHGIFGAAVKHTNSYVNGGFFSRQRDVEIVPVHICDRGSFSGCKYCRRAETDRDLPRDEAIRRDDGRIE